MKLSVVIVSYNVKFYIEQCLLSVRRASRDVETEVWVVDNASSDGTPDYLRARFPEVHLIANEQNVGFSRANNMAIGQASGEYVLLLNPDTIVGENVLKECIEFLDAHPQAGATGVAMLKDDGSFAWESRRGLPTPFTAFCKMSGLCALFPRSRRFGRYYMRYLDRRQANPIDVISGAFNMLRRSALDKAGWLDEDFFMYGEDIDLSCRMLNCGYENYYLPVRILHYKGESTVKSSFRYVNAFYRAMLIFFDKHYRRSHRWLTPLIRLAVVVRGFLDFCIRQKNRLFRFFCGRRNKEAGKRFLYLGTAEVMEEVCRKAVECQLRIDFREAGAALMPDGHLDPSVSLAGYDYVLYDTSAYTYEHILSLMERTPGHDRVRLATYSAETKKLITFYHVY